MNSPFVSWIHYECTIYSHSVSWIHFKFTFPYIFRIYYLFLRINYIIIIFFTKSLWIHDPFRDYKFTIFISEISIMDYLFWIWVVRVDRSWIIYLQRKIDLLVRVFYHTQTAFDKQERAKNTLFWLIPNLFILLIHYLFGKFIFDR